MKILSILLLLSIGLSAFSQIQITEEAKNGYFRLVSEKGSAPIVVDSEEKIEVKTAASLFSGDVEKVSGLQPQANIILINRENIP